MTDSTTKKPAELESLRADIDRSDEAIVGALRTRLGAVRRIAEVKRLQGLPVYDAVREASLLYKLRSMAGSDVEGVALPVYRTMMAAARRFEAQSQEAGEAVSGTVTLRLRSPADFTAVTEIFAVHDYVPESLGKCGGRGDRGEFHGGSPLELRALPEAVVNGRQKKRRRAGRQGGA